MTSACEPVTEITSPTRGFDPGRASLASFLAAASLPDIDQSPE
jgi:hypothetical protein